MIKVILLGLFLFSGCATLLPIEQRNATFIDQTGVKKQIAHSKAMAWFAKNFKDSNRVIKVSDVEQGKLIGKGYLYCKALNDPLGLIQANNLHVVIDLEFKDNKMKSTWYDMEMFNDDFISESLNITSEEKLNTVINECVLPTKASLLHEITNPATTTNW